MFCLVTLNNRVQAIKARILSTEVQHIIKHLHVSLTTANAPHIPQTTGNNLTYSSPLTHFTIWSLKMSVPVSIAKNYFPNLSELPVKQSATHHILMLLMLNTKSRNTLTYTVTQQFSNKTIVFLLKNRTEQTKSSHHELCHLAAQ